MEAKAIAKGLPFSPAKARLAVDMVRGKRVEEALSFLQFTPTRAAREVAKVIKSAAANAENNLQLNPATLKVLSISADPGPTRRRFRPQARGRTNRILKRSCHITAVVGEGGDGA